MNNLSRRSLFKAALMMTAALSAPAAASSKAVAKPPSVGAARNIAPDLEDAAHLIYRVHSGPVASINAVYDGGARLICEGDVPDLAALLAVRPERGMFWTCKATGRIRLGISPWGVLTADVSASDRPVHVHRDSELAGAVSPDRKAELRAAGLLI